MTEEESSVCLCLFSVPLESFLSISYKGILPNREEEEGGGGGGEGERRWRFCVVGTLNSGC